MIAQYLDNFKPNPLFYPTNLEENTYAKLLETVADGICDSIVLIFLENSRKEALRSKTWVKRQEKKSVKELNFFQIISKKKIFCRKFFSIADISVFTCLEYLDLRFPKFKWRDKYQNLVSFWEIKNRQSFVETKPVAQIIESLDD